MSMGRRSKINWALLLKTGNDNQPCEFESELELLTMFDESPAGANADCGFWTASSPKGAAGAGSPTWYCLFDGEKTVEGAGVGAESWGPKGPLPKIELVPKRLVGAALVGAFVVGKDGAAAAWLVLKVAGRVPPVLGLARYEPGAAPSEPCIGIPASGGGGSADCCAGW